MKRAALAVTLVALMLASSPGPVAQAASTPSGTQDRIDEVLREHPGGDQTAWNEISWDDGAVILTLASTYITPFAAVGGCTSGRFCAYNQTGYRGDKLTFSTCTSSHSVSALAGAVRSIANSRSTGSIRAYAGSTLLATAAAGTGSNVTGTTTKFVCS